MSDAATITTQLNMETWRVLTDLAVDRGIAAEKLAGELIEQAVADKAALRVAIEEGRRQITSGDHVIHGGPVRQIRRWKQEQRRAA